MKNRLSDLKDELDLKAVDVANDIGVVKSIYSEWEHNKKTIPTKRIYDLANYFKVNIDYMLGLTDVRIKLETSNEIDINKVATNLKEIRKSLNYTLEKLAKKLNTSPSVISNYENGKFLIRGFFLIDLCKLSNFSIDWVLGRSDKKHIK